MRGWYLFLLAEIIILIICGIVIAHVASAQVPRPRHCHPTYYLDGHYVGKACRLTDRRRTAR